MTPTELEQAARERYNAVGETFWSSSEMRTLIYAACQELALETKCIERVYTTTTVASTQEYEFPTNVISVIRVTWYGQKLEPIDQRMGDSLTLSQNGVSVTGTPQYYAQFNNTFILYPTPNDAQALKVWAAVEAQPLTTASTELEVPTWTHTRLINFLLAEMYPKDKDFTSAGYYRGLWNNDKAQVKAWMRKRLRGDAPAQVKDEMSLPNTILGVV